MQLDVDLQEPFSYSSIGLILLILLIVAFITVLIVRLVLKAKKNQPVIQYVPVADINRVKGKYLKMIDELVESVNTKKLSDRRSYNELSGIIRKFTFEATNIDVMKCSLNDIRKLKMPALTKLVEEYYEPEFSYEGTGDILASIERTKEVILSWK
jgi:hypothetical protein